MISITKFTLLVVFVMTLTNLMLAKGAPLDPTTTAPHTTQQYSQCGSCPAGEKCYKVFPVCTTPPPNCEELKQTDPSRSCVFPCPPFYTCSAYEIFG
nr:hypothetical protein BgiMline_027073 [Biomphalaria glabrata]